MRQSGRGIGRFFNNTFHQDIDRFTAWVESRTPSSTALLPFRCHNSRTDGLLNVKEDIADLASLPAWTAQQDF